VDVLVAFVGALVCRADHLALGLARSGTFAAALLHGRRAAMGPSYLNASFSNSEHKLKTVNSV